MEMYIKYPRTFHLPWSAGKSSDDKVLSSIDHFLDKEVIVSEKMDGENTSLYKDYIHARSIDSRNHSSRNWVKNFWNNIGQDIPKGWRICGENLYAQHSIKYNNLKSYFYGFSIWDENNVCLSWEETIEWFTLLNIVPVPVLYKGLFNIDIVKIIQKELDKDKIEGYIIRLADSFKYNNFKYSIAKYVRKNHVQTDKHWKFKEIIPNKLI